MSKKKKEQRISYRVTFELLIEGNGDGVISDSVTKNIREIIESLVMNDTTHWDENDMPHFLFPRHLKLRANNSYETGYLFP